MHRPRGKSVSQTQDNESLPNIDAQLDYINKLLRWSTGDLDHFIAVLMARLLAEEGYIRALEAIDRVPAAPAPEAPYSRTKYFGDQPSTFETALTEYTASVKNVVAQRRELVKGIKAQIKVMQGIKENQEKQHRTINEFVGEKNSRYLTFRTNDFFKRQRAYVHKCADLEAAQQALQPTAAKDDFVVTEEDAEEQAADTSSSSPREEEIPAAPETQGSSNNNKRGNNIVLALRSQIAQAISTDPSKQNMKVAKLKRDVAETDLEYRRAAHRLELLRIMQVETARQAMKHIEVLFLMKADWARSVLYNITMAEEAALSKETLIVQARRERIQELDARKDVQLFCNQFERTMRFDVPAPIFYENHYFGRVNNVHFGASLRGYAKIHGRNVPIIVERCIQAVEAMGGLEKEGIYRISGRQSNINALKIEFEKDEHVNLDNTDVFTIASVLKIYLRELEEPLFPLSMSYRAEYSIKDTSSRLQELKTKINELPLPHRETLYIVIRHLARVNAQSEVNKMNMQNISVIFTPAIFHDHNQAENVGEWCTDKVLEDLIHHCDQLFGNHNQNNENSDPASLKGHERTGSNSSQIPTPPPKNAKAGHQRTGSAPSAAQQANIVRKDSLRRPIPIRRDSLRSKNSAN